MKVINFQYKKRHVTETISLALHDFDFVIVALMARARRRQCISFEDLGITAPRIGKRCFDLSPYA